MGYPAAFFLMFPAGQRLRRATMKRAQGCFNISRRPRLCRATMKRAQGCSSQYDRRAVGDDDGVLKLGADVPFRNDIGQTIGGRVNKAGSC